MFHIIIFTLNSCKLKNSDIEVNEMMHDQALLSTENICYLVCGSLFVKLGMSAPDCGKDAVFNGELKRKREYDRHELDQSVQTNGSE